MIGCLEDGGECHGRFLGVCDDGDGFFYFEVLE